MNIIKYGHILFFSSIVWELKLFDFANTNHSKEYTLKLGIKISKNDSELYLEAQLGYKYFSIIVYNT